MTVIPSATWQMLEQRMSCSPLPRGLDAAWDAGVGMIDRFVPRKQRFIRCADKVISLENDFSMRSDSKLRDIAHELREIFRCHRDGPSDLDRAFALIREVAFRQIGEKPFPVQVAGAFALESGCVTEMPPGRVKHW